MNFSELVLKRNSVCRELLSNLNKAEFLECSVEDIKKDVGSILSANDETLCLIAEEGIKDFEELNKKVKAIISKKTGGLL